MESFLSHPQCQPAGLGARDILRLEMGYPLYGHELNNENSPVVMSDGHFIDFNKIFIEKKNELDLSNDSSRIAGLRLNSKLLLEKMMLCTFKMRSWVILPAVRYRLLLLQWLC